jgi:DNA-binding beta-propeller fold protein YncE
MSLKLQGTIDLPAHKQAGGFDHAAVHTGSSRLYVAHTSNDAIDVIDCANDQFLFSIPDLTGVAGALVSEARSLVFTSNRGENTVGIFAVGDERNIAKVKVGIRPNGLSFDPRHGLLLVANVGNPDIPNSFTVSVVDVERREMIHSIPVPSRTRWTIFDSASSCFYVNIAEPYQIVVIDSGNPTRVIRSMEIPAKGPHGLDFDPTTNRLFCACDAGQVFALDMLSGKILLEADLSGVPDVIFFNAALKHLYVAVGDPGVIDLFEIDSLQRIDTISTEMGAHTIGFEAVQNKVYAFLPESHRAAVYLDTQL